MKTQAQIKFDQIVKKGFHEVLKPLGFKKKALNFYLQLADLGQIIQIQKSSYSTSFEIKFTINIGIFEPKFWLDYYDFKKTGVVPDFPTEPDCLIRKRIGQLQKTNDIWYEINENTDENALIFKMVENLKNEILPFLERLNTIEKIFQSFENEEVSAEMPLGELIFYAKHGDLEKAQKKYQNLYEKTIQKDEKHPFLGTLKSYAKKYGLKIL